MSSEEKVFYAPTIPLDMNWMKRLIVLSHIGEGGVIMTNVEEHMVLCRQLNELYAKKNHDYGNSFHKTWQEEGIAMARIRLTDKLERFKRLTRVEQRVSDESVRDTLLDLANYAIMTVMELDREE